MFMITKSVLLALLSFILVSGLMFAGVMHVSAEAPEIITVISSDATWTKADSPYDFTASVFVSDGVTLTIEAGTTVNFNGIDVLINGTLRAIGSSDEKIHLNGGSIEFSQYSHGWDEQSGSGCIIEYAVLIGVDIVSHVSLKISYSSVDGQITVGGSSIIQGNTINVLSITKGSTIVTHNTINEIPSSSGSLEISYNTIGSLQHTSSFSGDSPIVSHNTIDKIGDYIIHPNGRFEINYFYADTPIITNNIVKEGIYVNVGSKNIFNPENDDGHFAVITDNTVTGYVPVGGGTETPTLATKGIVLVGEGDISGNRISGCSTGIEGGSLIEGNYLFNNTYGINARGGEVVIRGNSITLGDTGILNEVNTEMLIENNYISNQTSYGISIRGSYDTIQNNTISGTAIAIRLSAIGWTEINYNNFEGYRENSIYLDGAISDQINATYNWWGTTDTQAINQTIYDFKYDFNLGKVNFTPFLTEPNTEALSSEIPEFPSLLLLPLFLVATFVVVVVRKKILGGNCIR